MVLSGRMLRKFLFSVSKCAFSLPAPLLHTMLKWSQPVKDAVSVILVYPAPLLWCWKYSSSIPQQVFGSVQSVERPKRAKKVNKSSSQTFLNAFLIIRNSGNAVGIHNRRSEYQSPDLLASNDTLLRLSLLILIAAYTEFLSPNLVRN